jgi:hypothetical protein
MKRIIHLAGCYVLIAGLWLALACTIGVWEWAHPEERT